MIQSLFDGGLARPGPLGLGLATSADGQLLGADGRPSAALYTLGPMRLRELWETTAIPEIREQARDLAALLTTKANPRLRLPRHNQWRMMHPLGRRKHHRHQRSDEARRMHE